MISFKHALAGLILIGSTASPAFAQGESADKQNLSNNSITFTAVDGTILRRSLPEAKVAELVAQATPMNEGVMMMMHKGKMYMMTDKKMADGKMMSEMAMKH